MSRCLVLNANYEYLSIEDRWIDALCLVIAGKADVLEAYPEVVRSQYLSLPLPAVVVMRYVVRTRRRRAIFDSASRSVVFTRDDFTCQYCGVRVSMASGTRDHVIPRSRSGPDILSNVVTACRTCNTRKTVRTRERAIWQACLRRHGITLWTSRAA
jgi:5-methylcytosine-specific restriction endonuclease McrA